MALKAFCKHFINYLIIGLQFEQGNFRVTIMESKQEATKKKRSLISKLAKILAWIIASVLFLVLVVLILIQTAFVQNFARKKVVSYLEHKLKTKVAIGKLDIKFPKSLSLQNVFFEDQSRDTLLYGGEIKVDIDMVRMLKNDIQIKEIALNDIVMKVKRLPPDSVFNFQFIADAFSSEQKKVPSKEDTATLKMNIDRILVNNTHIIYRDAFTGNDMNLALGHLDTKITTFDPEHLRFNIPIITLSGLKGYFYQVEPLQKSIQKTVAEASAAPETFLQFMNQEMNFSNIDVVYKSEPSHLNSSIQIGSIIVHPKTIDLKNSLITLKDATLSNSDLGIETASKAPVKKPQDTVVPNPPPSMKIISGPLAISNTNLKYDDQSAPRAKAGMDFSHLELKQLSTRINHLEYSTDTINASVASASMKEKSGFVLDDFTTDFSMVPSGVSLENLLIRTPGTEIKKAARLSYPSLASVSKNPGQLELNIDLENSKIAMRDVWTFMPSMKQQTPSLTGSSTLYVDARITGKVNDLDLQKVLIRGLTATNIDVKGMIKGLPDSKKLYTDLAINKFQTSRQDLLAFLPKNALPKNITLPTALSANGRVKGGMNDLTTDLVINTTSAMQKSKAHC